MTDRTDPARHAIDLDVRVDIAANVHARKLDRELVILDLANGEYWGLDPVGARIWEGLSHGKSPREIATLLEVELVVESTQLTADILRITSELVERKLIVVRSNPRP